MAGLGSLYGIYTYTIPKNIVKPQGTTPAEVQFYEYASIKEGEDWYMSVDDFFASCGFATELKKSKTRHEIDRIKAENLEKFASNESTQKFFDLITASDAPSNKGEKNEYTEVIKFFKSIDINNDGKLSLEEFQTFMTLLKSPAVDLQAFLKAADVNHDDVLTYEEFQNAVKNYLPKLTPLISEENFRNNFLFKYFSSPESVVADQNKGLSFSQFLNLMNEIESFIIQNDFDKLKVGDRIPVTLLNDYFISQTKVGNLPKHVLENLYILATNQHRLEQENWKKQHEELSKTPAAASSSTTNQNQVGLQAPPTTLSDFGINFSEFQALHSFIKHIETIENFIQLNNAPMNREQFRTKMENYFGEKLPVREIDWIFDLFANPSSKELDHYSCFIIRNQLNSDLPQNAPQMALWQSMILGGVSAMCGATTVFPLDKVKTRIQSNPTAAANGILSNLASIAKQEGVFRLYRGIQAQLIGITPEKALKLTVNDFLRKRIAKRHELETGKSNVQLTVKEEMLAGIGTGLVQVFVTNPIEVVKIRLQMQTTVIKSPATVIKELGFTGLYQGLSATLLRDVPFNAMYFSIYQGLKKVFSSYELDKQRAKLQKQFNNMLDPSRLPVSVDLNAGYLLLASCLAGSFAAGLDTPADCIKTNLQNGQNKYTGIIDCARGIIKKQGVGALFRGWKARVLIISPLFGITMMCYEMLQRYFFPHSTVGVAILDEDFASMRRARLRFIDHQLQLRYTPLYEKE